MKRRKFLEKASLGGAAAILSGCAVQSKSSSEYSLNNNEVIELYEPGSDEWKYQIEELRTVNNNEAELLFRDRKGNKKKIEVAEENLVSDEYSPDFNGLEYTVDRVTGDLSSNKVYLSFEEEWRIEGRL